MPSEMTVTLKPMLNGDGHLINNENDHKKLVYLYQGTSEKCSLLCRYIKKGLTFYWC
jgi:hypothetical protein